MMHDLAKKYEARTAKYEEFISTLSAKFERTKVQERSSRRELKNLQEKYEVTLKEKKTLEESH